MRSSYSFRELEGSDPTHTDFRVVLTAIEGHVIASCVQSLPAAGGAPGWGPGICVGAGAGLHLLLQNQPANSTLELGVGEEQENTEPEEAWGAGD